LARLLGSKCKLCRREGLKLFLKGARCDSPQCAIVKRNYPPGQHGWRRGKFSDYGLRLREKQRLKRYYGVLERQFRRYFQMASNAKGNTGEQLLSIFERRIDNVIYRLGLAVSRSQARQIITHGHISLNGRKHTIPSALVSVDDIIEPGKKEKSESVAKSNLELSQGRVIPAWLEFDVESLRARVAGVPGSDEIKEVVPIREQLIVEISSR